MNCCRQNLKQLKTMRLLNGKQLNIVELPMPDEVIYEDQRLPASYANFYISNQSVIVPTFDAIKMKKPLKLYSNVFLKGELSVLILQRLFGDWEVFIVLVSRNPLFSLFKKSFLMLGHFQFRIRTSHC